MKKKIFWLLAALVATLCLFTVSASAATVASGECGADGNNLTWILDDAGHLTIFGTGDMANSYDTPWRSHRNDIVQITIGDSVTSIGNYAFDSYNNLTSVTIGDSVTSIGEYAFYSCRNLTSVTIGNSVTSIGYNAFSNCTSLASVTIGDSVTSIGEQAFYSCTSLAAVTIGDSVTSIGSSAFSNCTNLASVTIGDSVTFIGDYAFSKCTSLASVTIGDAVTSSGYNAFSNCTSLASVQYTGNVAGWCGIAFRGVESNPLSYAKNLYIDGALVTDLVIPQGVSTVKALAFYNATCLKSVELPLSLEAAGNSAFYGCTGITKVSYPGTAQQWAEILFGTGNEGITTDAPEHAHIWEDIAFIVTPTCHTAGTKAHKCTSCGTIEVAVAPATGNHKWDEGEIAKLPNRHEAGSRLHKCTNTGCTATKTDILPKYLFGDLNGDGVVTIKDVTLLRRFIAGGYGVELQ